MNRLSNKAKQYGLIALKVFILSVTIWFIWNRLSTTNSGSFELLSSKITNSNWWVTFVFIVLAVLNWVFEIAKWQSLVQTLKKISFAEAGRQCLAALSASLATPNRIGEYGVKAYYFAKEDRKKVMVLKFVANTSQMFVTLLFGIPGLIFFILKYDISVLWWKPLLLIISIVVLLFLGYFFRKQQILIKGLTIENLTRFIRSIPLGVRIKVVFFSIFRYLVFSSLFYLILKFFGVKINVFEFASLITTMYLLSSVIPTFTLFDVAIKGSVSIWVFGLAGVAVLPILSTVLFMWLLNFVLPTVFGSIFIVKFKPTET